MRLPTEGDMEVISQRKRQGVPLYLPQFTESNSLRITSSQNPLSITEQGEGEKSRLITP